MLAGAKPQMTLFGGSFFRALRKKGGLFLAQANVSRGTMSIRIVNWDK